MTTTTAAIIDLQKRMTAAEGRLAALEKAPPVVTPPPVIVSGFPPISALSSSPTTGGIPLVGSTVTANGLKTTHLADGYRHQYATIQAENADGSKLLLLPVNAALSGLNLTGAVLYDAKTLQKIGPVTLDDTPRWSNTDGSAMFGISSGRLVLRHLDGSVGLSVVLPFSGGKIGSYEGGPSDDDSLIPVGTDDGTGRWCVVDHGAVSAVMTGASDNVKVSRTGKYVVVVGASIEVLDRQLNRLRTLPALPNHGDTALDANGDDVFVMNNAVYAGIARGVMSFRLVDGSAKTLIPPGSAFEYGHVSGRGPAGWYGLSVRDTQATAGRLGVDSVVTVNDSGSVRQYGRAHRSGSSAAGEPQASLSRNGLRAYVATDAGGSVGELVLEAA